MRSVKRKVRAENGASVGVVGVAFKRAYTTEQRRSNVMLAIVYPRQHHATTVILKRGRARELRDLLSTILGDL